ncbi:hypothetical protein [uncultured Aquimarina sp.]|uniref:hypothetical protein n=1 Tax=uncultured Aquimarina sp. TaxID=575652 RepID=UPI00262FB6F5|nr:hypothetical protein [uncultured Aquimarina sp.]
MKTTYITLFLIILLSTVCISNINTKPTHSRIKGDTILFQQPEVEYLSETLYVNSKYPLEGEIVVLKSFIGKPNTVQKQIDDCGAILEDSDEIWKYLHWEIEVSKTEYAFRKIDVELSNFTIKHKKVIFSKNYTLLNFEEDFPVSFTKNRDHEKDGIITILMKTHPLSDDLYIFTFHNKKLKELCYFFPC